MQISETIKFLGVFETDKNEDSIQAIVRLAATIKYTIEKRASEQKCNVWSHLIKNVPRTK